MAMTGALFQHFYEERNRIKLVGGVTFERPFAGRRAEKFAAAAAADRLPIKRYAKKKV